MELYKEILAEIEFNPFLSGFIPDKNTLRRAIAAFQALVLSKSPAKRVF